MSQDFWTGLYRNWIWLGAPVVLVSAAALVWVIVRLVTLIRRAQLCKVPLAASQKIWFSQPGRVVLCIEGPRFTRRFAGVDFDLRGPDGEPMEGRRFLLRSGTSGLSKVRMSLLEYDLPRSGQYVLNMMGVGSPAAGDDRHAVVFMKPHLRQVLIFIMGILLASHVFIASLVFLLMRLAEVPIGE